MRLLLDTGILHDWRMGAMADTEAVRSIRQAGTWVSAVSIWEMAIQQGLGKLPFPSRQIVADVGAQGFGWLNITPGHAQAVLDLVAHHQDPFDRLLIVQARCEGMRMVTHDRLFRDYLPDTILVRAG
jgi:PIN domain nuclease of toxin-antitoxin system